MSVTWWRKKIFLFPMEKKQKILLFEAKKKQKAFCKKLLTNCKCYAIIYPYLTFTYEVEVAFAISKPAEAESRWYGPKGADAEIACQKRGWACIKQVQDCLWRIYRPSKESYPRVRCVGYNTIRIWFVIFVHVLSWRMGFFVAQKSPRENISASPSPDFDGLIPAKSI